MQNEVEITEICQPIELENSSTKSFDAGSEEGLAPTKRWTPPRTADQKKETYYREVIERVTSPTNMFETTVETSNDGPKLSGYFGR